jgi:tRNA A-37 threonylcarbamoyl transferase component Bud32
VSVLDDRYELRDVIGRGGTADVYSATDNLLGREVAVKVLRSVSATESDRQRFVSEARTLAALDHPNLVTVLDAGIDSDELYLVLTLITGQSLGDRPREPMPLDEVAAIGAQLADALAYAHDNGVVHRDVKPSNVLVAEEGQVWLADFGISRVIGEAVRYTETGKLIGTAAYLAPEQVQGTAITPAADVYSLGLVLLELITGRLAYPGPPVEAALARLTNSPAVPDDLPKAWRQLLTRMTALEPGERYTADCCAAELRALAADPEPTRVIVPDDRPTALMDVPFADVRRRRTSLLAAAVAALLVLIVSGLVLIGRNTDQDRPRAGLPAEVAAAEIPPGVAPALRKPLQALHDAVQAIPGDTLPSVAVTVRRIDGAITRHEYKRARVQLASLVDTVEVAQANHLVADSVAKRLLGAAADLRTALLAAEQRATSATRTTAPAGGDNTTGPAKKKPGKKKSPGKGHGKG